MDWLINNWEIYFSFAFALAILWLVFFKQEFDSYRQRGKAEGETEKQNPKKNMSTKKKAGGGVSAPAGRNRQDKSPKDS